jgi:hypothetical protein
MIRDAALLNRPAESGVRKVNEVNEWAILKRAKELCEQDGYEWQLDYKPAPPMGTKIKLKRFLDEAGRSGYLARAREQLLKECAEDA